MRRIALGLALGMLLGTATAAAQTGAGFIFAPRLEVAAGYSYLRASTVTSGFNLHGGSVSAAVNMNSWLGFVGEVAYGSTKNVPPSGFSLNVTSYLFGPRVSYRGDDRFTVFAHNLIGVGHAGGTLYTAGFQQGTSPPAAQNAFAMASGAGVDVNLGRRWAIRAVQTDWLFTTFPNGAGNHQHSFRLATGIVWRIGSR
jgi:peptidoglycan-associated lipoprotein